MIYEYMKKKDNILVLHGSAHINGASDTLINEFLKGLNEPAANIQHFRPSQMNIAHCQACEKCNNGKGCIINDDMQAVYPALKEASLIIIASPSFWGYMTSQLKTLFDRLEAVVHPDYFGNKDFILFVTYRRYYGSLLEWMKRITAGFESRLHHLCVQTFDPNTNKDIPITEMKEALEKAFDLGQSIRTKRSD